MNKLVKLALRKLAADYEHVTNPEFTYDAAGEHLGKIYKKFPKEDRLTLNNALADMYDMGMRGVREPNTSPAYKDAFEHNKRIVSDYLKNNEAPQFKELLGRYRNGGIDRDYSEDRFLEALADPAGVHMGYTGAGNRRNQVPGRPKVN